MLNQVRSNVPGPWTPKRYEPNVKILAFASTSPYSPKPNQALTLCTHSLTSLSKRPSTSSRRTASWLLS